LLATRHVTGEKDKKIAKPPVGLAAFFRWIEQLTDVKTEQEK